MARQHLGERIARLLSVARALGDEGVTSNQVFDLLKLPNLPTAAAVIGQAMRYGYMECIGSKPHRSWAAQCKVYAITAKGLERIADHAPMRFEAPQNVAQGSGKWPEVQPPRVSTRAGVRYVQAPIAPDRRWIADGPGAGFMAEWRALRGQ